MAQRLAPSDVHGRHRLLWLWLWGRNDHVVVVLRGAAHGVFEGVWMDEWSVSHVQVLGDVACMAIGGDGQLQQVVPCLGIDMLGARSRRRSAIAEVPR